MDNLLLLLLKRLQAEFYWATVGDVIQGLVNEGFLDVDTSLGTVKK